MGKYRKRVICIDFKGKTIKTQPWIEKRLKWLFTMGIEDNKPIEKIIYLNYGNTKLLITDCALPDTNSACEQYENYTDFVIEYLGLLRCNMKSARKL